MAFPVGPANGATTTQNGIDYIYSSAENAWTRVAYTAVSAQTFSAADTIKASGNIVAASTTISTNATTGALVVKGGAGIAGNVYTDALYTTTGLYWASNAARIATGIKYTTSSSPPSSPTLGDQWYDTTTDILYEYVSDGVSSYWVDIGSPYFYTNASLAGTSLTVTGLSTLNTVNIVGTTPTTSPTTGALIVAGGAGISGNANIGSITATTSTTTGALVVAGGVGIGGNANIGSTTSSTSSTTGALVVAGGVGIGGNIVQSGWHLPSANLVYNLGSTTAWWNVFYGKSVQAQYADLAEVYVSDLAYDPGTVVIFGGTAEITTTSITHDTRVAGVISTNPAYLMNSVASGIPVAMTGRVPCLVKGPVTKGTVLVTSTTPGVAQSIDYDLYRPGAVVGKSLEEIADNSIKTIEVVVGRF